MSEKINVQNGWFYHWMHDLYGGISYYGPFESEQAAQGKADEDSGYDRIEVLYIPYVEHKGSIYGLWGGNRAQPVERAGNPDSSDNFEFVEHKSDQPFQVNSFPPGAFSGCTSVESFDIQGWGLSGRNNFLQMFIAEI